MDAMERSRDIFEAIPGYPCPPLVPLPDRDDLETFADMGFKLDAVSRPILKATMAAMGFNVFRDQLPNTLEDILRKTNSRTPGLFAPLISAVLTLQDDPRVTRPAQRAASLLFAAHSLHADIMSARLEPDMYRDQVLEMGQYPNLFSTCLVVENNDARIFKSTNIAQIGVLIRGQFYILNTGAMETETSIGQVEAALEGLIQAAQREQPAAGVVSPGNASPGTLTAASDPIQLRVFQRMQQNPVNARSLQAMRHTFLTLCLDLDNHPANEAEAAKIAHSQNYANRWFHAGLQLIVFGNAKACAICNFTAYLAGNTMMRAASELQKRGAASPLPPAEQTVTPLPAAEKLTWEIRPEALQMAQKSLEPILDQQQATFEIPGFGRDFFKAQGLDPVPTFILALEMASKRLSGRVGRVTQFLTMSRYRCMDLLTTDVTTPEMERCVATLEGAQVDYDQAMEQIQAAVASQARECRLTRRYMPMSMLINLFFRSRRKGLPRRQALLLFNIAFFLLRLLGRVKLAPREILVSHPEIYPEVTVVGRPGIRLPYVKDFGLHYQILRDRIVVTMMPGVRWTTPNEQVIRELTASLERLRQVVCREA